MCLGKVELAVVKCIDRRVRTNLDGISILLARLRLREANSPQGGVARFRHRSVKGRLQQRNLEDPREDNCGDIMVVEFIVLELLSTV